MTKAIKYIFLLSAVLLALSACGGSDEPTAPTQPTTAVTEPATGTTAPTTAPTAPPTEPAPLSLDFTRESDGYTLKDADDVELIRVSVARPVVERLPGVSDYYADWLNDLKFNISLSLEDARQQYITRSVFYPFMYHADFEVKRNDGVLFSVWRSYTEETGGAHGTTTYMSENFVAHTGALLTMDDFFSVPQSEYYPRIKDTVLAEIDERYGSMGEGTLFDGFEQTMMEVYDPKHFCVTDTGVIFFWQEYELGPYAAGAQIFEVPFETLADIINSAWIK